MSSPAMRVGVARLCRRFALSALLATAIATAVLAAQSPQRPTFRGAAVLVNVDVYPTRGGQLVQGLAPADFDVFEDGVLQKVDNFEFVHIESNPADGERRDPNTQEEGEALAADPHHRVFVVYFDIYHLSTEGARNLRAPVREFLERVIGPKDYVAALTPDITVHDMVFGQRLETIEDAVDRYWRRVFDMSTTTGGLGAPQSAEEQFLQDCFLGSGPGSDALVATLIGRWRLDAVLTGLREVTARLAAIRDERANILLFSGGWALGGPNNQLSQHAWASQPTLRGGLLPPVRTGPGMAPRTSAQCDAELQRLAAIDFSQSFLDILDTAKRSNVAISTIDPAGLSIYDINLAEQSPRNRNPQAKLEPLRVLASNTNGTAIVSTNDLKTPLRRIADEVSSYYLLGYYSTNTKFDGKYRKIEVKAKAPGVKILARRGYVALTDAAFNGRGGGAGKPASPPAGPSPVDDALAALARLQSPESLRVDGVASAAEVAVVAELSADQMGEWPNGADVTVTLMRADGAPLGTKTGHLDSNARSLLVRLPIDPGPGPWRAKVELASAATKTSSVIELRRTTGSLLDDPLVFRATPAARSPLSPVAVRAFRRSERLHIEWAMTGTLDHRLGRLLDRRGQPLPIAVALTDREVSGHPVLAADVLLAPLAPGDYVIEVVAGLGATTERRLVAFRIEPS